MPNCLPNTYPNIYRLLPFSPCVKGSSFCSRQLRIQSAGQSAETSMGCPSIITPTPKAQKASQKRGRRNGAGKTKSVESGQERLTHLSTANQLQLPTQDRHEVMPAKYQHGRRRILKWRIVLCYWSVSNTREVGRSESHTAISRSLI